MTSLTTPAHGPVRTFPTDSRRAPRAGPASSTGLGSVPTAQRGTIVYQPDGAPAGVGMLTRERQGPRSASAATAMRI